MNERSVSPDYSISDSSSTCSENMGDISKETWSGTSILDMLHKDSPWNYYCPPLVPSRHHTVLIELPTNSKDMPKPHISSNTCHWDVNHVRMPFAPENLFPNKENNKLQPRWDIIQCALLRSIKDSYELEDSIFTYNLRRKKLFALHELFENEFDEEETKFFFDTLLPKIINLALQLPELIKTPIPLLKQGRPHAITLSQLQIASLLANAFLCTFPWKKEYTTYPGINFNRLFECKIKSDPEIGQKIKCIIHYFRRVCSCAPVGLVTFERKHLPRSLFPRWDKIETPISNIKLHVSSDGTIERNGLGMLQVDFANSFIGGGVLGYGCVQEEIRFVICPELIISKLFTEQLTSNESLLMIGAECFSNYKGYASSFEWVDNFDDPTPLDDYGRKQTSIIAIDAIYYYKSSAQFMPSKIIRELNKAYIGFYERIPDYRNSQINKNPLSPVATGNWGCGAFRGNVHLKALIQIMACTAANRHIVYYTFGDKKLQHAIVNIYNFLTINQITIVQLWRYLCLFIESSISSYQLYPFIKQCHVDKLNNKSTINNDEKTPDIEQQYIQTNNSTKKNNLDIPSTSKQNTTNENKNFELEKENPSNLTIIDDVDFIDNSQEWETPKNLKRTKSKMEEYSKLKGKSKKTPLKNLGSLFYSSDEDDSKFENNDGFLTELDKVKSYIPNKITNPIEIIMDTSNSSSDDELMEICVENDTSKTIKLPKQNNFNQQKTSNENKPSDTSSKRKTRITDYYTIK